MRDTEPCHLCGGVLSRMLSAMQYVAIWASVAFLSYLVMWATILNGPRRWARANLPLIRMLLDADCTICTSVYTTLSWATGYWVADTWFDIDDVDLWVWFGAPFMAGFMLLLFKIAAMGSDIIESYIIDLTGDTK